MKRPATLLALIAIALLAFATRSVAQFGSPGAPPAQSAEPAEPAPPPPPPPPEPEPRLEPRAEPSVEPAAGDGASAEPAVGEAELGNVEEGELPERAEAPSVLVPRTICEGRRIVDITVTGNGRVSADDVRAAIAFAAASAQEDLPVVGAPVR